MQLHSTAQIPRHGPKHMSKQLMEMSSRRIAIQKELVRVHERLSCHWPAITGRACHGPCGQRTHVVDKSRPVSGLDEEVIGESWMCIVMANGCNEDSLSVGLTSRDGLSSLEGIQ